MPLSLSCSKTIYYIAVFGLLVYPELYILEEMVKFCVQTNRYSSRREKVSESLSNSGYKQFCAGITDELHYRGP